MKLVQKDEQSWELTHRSWFFLGLSLVLVACLPPALTSGEKNSMIAVIVYLAFSVLCFYAFAEFSTLSITGSRIRYVRNFFLIRTRQEKDRSVLTSVQLEVSTRSRSVSKRIRFEFADGSALTMPKAFVGSTFGWKIDDVFESVRALFPEIANSPADPVLVSVQQGRTLDAIRLVREQHGKSLEEAKRFVEDLTEKES